MQTKSNINWKKLLQGVSLAAFAAAPILGATAVSQAAPPDHAPAYGYRNRDDRDTNRDDNDRDNDDHDRRSGGDEQPAGRHGMPPKFNVTVEGFDAPAP